MILYVNYLYVTIFRVLADLNTIRFERFSGVSDHIWLDCYSLQVVWVNKIETSTYNKNIFNKVSKVGVSI